MEAARTAPADGCPRRRAGRISGIVHVLRSGCRWCDCPPEYGPPTTIHSTLGRARNLGKSVPPAGREREVGRYPDDRLHLCQGPPLGGGRKRGEQKQAIGPINARRQFSTARRKLRLCVPAPCDELCGEPITFGRSRNGWSMRNSP